MSIRQVSAFLENKPGTLAKTLNLLSAAKVEIRALSLADTADFGILRFIADDNRQAAYTLSEAGLICSVTEVVAACADDRPGGMAAIISLLAEASVNVEYVYAFVAREGGKAWVVLRVDDVPAAEEILRKANISLMNNIAF